MFEFIGNISRGLFGGSSHVVKHGPQVIPVKDHPIFGGVKNIFHAQTENPSTPLPPSRHVRGGLPVHSPIKFGGPQQ